jgi:hypothetical protein
MSDFELFILAALGASFFVWALPSDWGGSDDGEHRDER